ncbi:MAG: Tetratricopeptide 1 repeat-containing protein [Candidatus Eremiobacteraeota bacterium]|nr:Tetratricopeptide 1 repeat-containing protein [Candidatus Eremiobacteraeota bacterium]
MNRRLFPTVLGLVAAAFVAAVGTHPGVAAPKPAATAAPAPAPSPTASPEPLDKAIPRLEAKLKTDPNDKQSLTELSADYLQINRPDLAIKLTQKLLAGGTKTAQVYYFDGLAQGQLGHQKEALADLEQAANLEPTNPGVLGTLTQTYLQSNRPQDAERVAKRAVTFNKDDKNAYMAYGQVLAAEGKYDEARQQLETGAKLDPKDPRPILLEAQTYISQNAIALAAGLYDRAIAIDPTNVEALFGKARLAAQQHNIKDAIATYETIFKLQVDPNDKAAVIDQEAIVYANEKMAGEADAAYKRAITEYPKVLSAHTAYGEYLLNLKDMAGAEREFVAGAGPNRDQVDALARLGQLYAQQSQYQKAVDQFKRVAELAPQDPRSFLLLGATYAANKQFANAAGAFKQSYSLQHTPDALLGLGQADLQTHNYTECAQVYDALDKGAPDISRQNPQVLFGLGQCYQGAKQPDKARAAYQRVLAMVKPGSQAANEIKALIAAIDRQQKKPAATKKPTTTSKT